MKCKERVITIFECFRPSREAERSNHARFTNPTYSQNSSSSLVPAVQYSSLGPRDTPTSYTLAGPAHKGPAPPQGAEERIYHVLEAEGGEKNTEDGDYQEIQAKEGEGVYHVLGEVGEGQGEGQDEAATTYEVPILSKERDESGTAYSSLQHK